MQISQKPKNNNFDDGQEELENLARKTNYVDTCTEELEKKSLHLPTVEGNGSSARPDVEELFAQKDEAVLKLKRVIRTLERGQSALNKEISRCHRNLDTIRSDTQKLTLEEPQNNYMAAEQEQGRELHKFIERRKSINNILKRAQLALEIAESKKFPGKTPQRKGAIAAAPSPSHHDDGDIPVKSPGGPFPLGPIVSNPKSDLSGETGGILSTGPLR